MGSRGTDTGKQLWEKINKSELENVMTDYWKAYSEFLPKELHVKSKKETWTVESYNGLLRHYLARFRRRTKCYSKSYEMLRYSILLFFAKKNNTLSIVGY
jgi:insertion element IS1 protein InsB